ncbi:MAG: M48 family peptidase [Pandoraea sp.]|nr:M48 family metallopeptidase [Burkholderiales bacterium]TAL56131.1 MAG: M48 family peptidase [Pandoraea sp.]TAM19071.1 MAG: M48 family peptidase [Pandoraea sp.]
MRPAPAVRPAPSRRSSRQAGPQSQLELPLFGADESTRDATPMPSQSRPPAAGPSTPSRHQRVLALEGHVLNYHFKRSSRRTIGFIVDESGLTVTAPRWVTIADVEAAIAEKQRWIFAKLAEWQERAVRRRVPRVTWVDGASLPYLGQPLVLRLGRPDRPGGPVHDAASGTLWLDLPPQAQAQQMRDRVQGWLQQQARQLFIERLELYASRLGTRYTALALSSAATRWGSCSADGRIRLNWRLIHFPLSVIDYVVAHELAHLKEMNHSPRFWQTVASVFPDFEIARASLKEHAPELVPEF